MAPYVTTGYREMARAVTEDRDRLAAELDLSRTWSRRWKALARLYGRCIDGMDAAMECCPCDADGADNDRLRAILEAIGGPEVLRDVAELLVFAHNAMQAPNIIDGEQEAERIRLLSLELRKAAALWAGKGEE